MFRRPVLSAFFSTLLSSALLLLLGLSSALQAQMEPTTRRGADEGAGPFDRLIIRGATVIDGTGAPPRGPVDIVVEGDRIVQVSSVGYPGVPISDRGRPQGATREIDAHGMYVLPGFVDTHVHTGGVPKAPQAEYIYKLWLAHGVTTVRGVPFGGFEWSLEEKALSERNEIVAPRMFTYHRPGTGWEGGPVRDAETARAWVRWLADARIDGVGVDGVKLGAEEPAVMAALIDEARNHGLGTVAHLDQMGVVRMTALDAARLGMHMMTHYYGLMESMLVDRSIQAWPLDYNYNNEQDRFGNVAHLWYQSAEPGSPQWNDLIQEFLELDFAMDPTMTIYEASRDLQRAMTAEWHEEYTLPSLWDYYTPSRRAHGSYWFNWTSEHEYHWKKFYQKWMRFLNDFKNAGGIVTVGTDSGFIYSTFGFEYVRELELLREAGFHPSEIFRAATMHGAMELFRPSGEPIDFGIVRPGLKADLVVVSENPLQNLKTLYGTGAFRLNDETGETERVRGIRYTIKDGIIYDAGELLADVRRMVREARDNGGS
jgi:imidazolonepropionase-like amidohydrolase